MKGYIQNVCIAGYKCLLYLPEKYCMEDKRYPVVYINGEDEMQDIMESIEPHFGADCSEFILLSITAEDWNNDFTPWIAPPLSKKSEPFGGGAGKYIDVLVNSIKPYMDEHYRTKIEASNTALLGYSLGGLTALYALYETDVFGKICSLSGSLWYDGWIEFMDCHTLINELCMVYMSLGKGEEHSKNQRIATVGHCTRKALNILKAQLKSKESLVLEWNEGGHFSEIPERFKKALLWVGNNLEKC